MPADTTQPTLPPAKSTRSYLAKLWALTAPYWRSEDWKLAWFLSLVVIGLNLGSVGLDVAFNYWNNDFYNSLQDKNFSAFKYQLGKFTILAFIWIIDQVYYLYMRQMLMIRWRRWLTEKLLGHWLDSRVYYLLQLKDYGTDNPEQRIEQDINLMTQRTVALAMGLLNSIVSLFSFMFILWSLSGPLSFSIGGLGVSIPGYMFWVALLYALVGSYITYRIGRPLVQTNVQQERYNASFRFGMSRLRDNAESVAFYGGEIDEGRRLTSSFADITRNWLVMMKQTKRVTWFTSFYGQAANIFPFIVGAPRYFSGAIQLGGLMQISSAFGSVQSALSWFVDAFTTLAEWKGSVNRLVSFVEAMDMAQRDASLMGGLRAHDETHGNLLIKDLNIDLPNNDKLLQDVNLSLVAGGRAILTGPSGSGKTTLFRTLAGLWPFGRGVVHFPPNARILFLPQKPYLPIATLREVLTFPLAPDAVTSDQLIEVLSCINLGQLATKLDETENWSMILSGGEQQRVAIARAILTKPDWLFMDEATSALDDANEQLMYRLLIQRLPNSSIISIAHRESLSKFHNLKISIDTARQSVTMSPLGDVA